MRNLSLIVAGAALASCQTAPPARQTRVVETREAMIEGVNPAALAIWDISSNAVADSGALNPGLIDAASWSRLAEAARMLHFYSEQMVEADFIRAGGPDIGSGEVPPGVATRAEIQAMIDADPKGFRDIARRMATQAAALVTAAEARDPVLAGELAIAIDEPCQSCHVRYWYRQ